MEQTIVGALSGSVHAINLGITAVKLIVLLVTTGAAEMGVAFGAADSTQQQTFLGVQQRQFADTEPTVVCKAAIA